MLIEKHLNNLCSFVKFIRIIYHRTQLSLVLFFRGNLLQIIGVLHVQILNVALNFDAFLKLKIY